MIIGGKVRLQVNETSTRQHRLGTVRLFRGIIRHEGIQGIYQGWTPAVVGSSVSWGGYFYFYEGFKRRLVDYKLGTTDSKQDAASILTSLDNFCLACAAGGLMVFVTNPVWLVKTRMQLQMKKASEKYNIQPYKNMMDAVRTIVRDEGPLALYRGCAAAVLLTSHGGVQFVVYEYLRKHFHYHRVGSARGNHARDEKTSVWHRFELSSGYLVMGATAKMYVESRKRVWLGGANGIDFMLSSAYSSVLVPTVLQA
jgi:solute carrier family 25 folate transporter 32